jgi:hypothetical protein
VNAATGNTFTPGDQLTGTGSNATLILADAANAALTNAFIAPGGASLSNIKTLTINGNNVAANVLDTSVSLFNSVTTLNINEGGQVTLTASATQAANLNLSATAALASVVNGGSTVNVTSLDATSGTLNIGQTTASLGAATAVVTGIAYAAATTNTAGVINVRAGSSVSVTQNAFANNAAAATDGAAGTRTLGAVAIDGTATTTAASSTQTNAIGAVNFAAATATTFGTTGVAGVVNGAVTIRDATAIAGTAAATAGTLATVTLAGYGNSTISSNALTTVNLSGTGGTLGLTTGLTTPTNRALAINTNALSNRDANLVATIANTITDSTAATGLGYTTFNITNTGATRITGIAAVDLTALTVAGAGSVTFTGVSTGMTSLQTITVTGSVGLSMISQTDATADLSTTITSINASGTSGNVSVNLAGLEALTTFTRQIACLDVDLQSNADLEKSLPALANFLREYCSHRVDSAATLSIKLAAVSKRLEEMIERGIEFRVKINDAVDLIMQIGAEEERREKELEKAKGPSELDLYIAKRQAELQAKMKVKPKPKPVVAESSPPIAPFPNMEEVRKQLNLFTKLQTDMISAITALAQFESTKALRLQILALPNAGTDVLLRYQTTWERRLSAAIGEFLELRKRNGH